MGRDFDHYFLQHEPLMRRITLGAFEEKATEFQMSRVGSLTKIPKHKGFRRSFILDPMCHREYLELGLEMMLSLSLEHSIRGKEILYGHVPIPETGEFENSRHSYGMGLEDQAKMWNAGYKYAVYVDGKDTYNSVLRGYISLLVRKYFNQSVQSRLLALFDRFPAGESGIPHGHATSHFLFYLLRLHLVNRIGIKANCIKMLSDDTFIYGETMEDAMGLKQIFEDEFKSSGIELNNDKERAIEPQMFEDGTWSFDVRKMSSRHNSIFCEILRYGDWRRISTGKRHRSKMTLNTSSSTDIGGFEENSKVEHRELLLWEELVRRHLEEGLNIVDPQIQRRGHNVLGNYKSEVLFGYEEKYLNLTPYCFDSLYRYSTKAGLVAHDPEMFLDKVLMSKQREAFGQANLIRRMGIEFPGIHQRNVTRLSNIVLEEENLSHLRVVALRELKLLGCEHRLADLCLLTEFNDCYSWNVERIDASNVLTKFAQRECLGQLGACHEYDLAIDVLCA